MKISVITVCWNSEKTIRHTLDSFFEQEYLDKEIVVIDGESRDATLKILDSYKCDQLKIFSGPDEGIYDAMNKGIKSATGEIVGFLNSDDFYPHSKVLSLIAEQLKISAKHAVFGDVNFVRPDKLEKIIRRYSSKGFHPDKFAYGYMPAHPTFYTKKIYYEKFGYFKTDYKIAADYELLIRFLYSHGLTYNYINQALVHMRTGGVSNASLMSRLTLNQEIVRACRENGLQTNLAKVLLKTVNKLKEIRL